MITTSTIYNRGKEFYKAEDMFMEIYSLCETKEQKDACLLVDFDWDECYYSKNFISAIEEGKCPTFEMIEDYKPKGNREYHHLCINGEWFAMYFE